MPNELDKLNLHKKSREHLTQAGITSLRQISQMSREELLTFKHIGAKTVDRIRAQAEAYINNTPIRIRPTPLSMTTGWFFDIETNPHTGEVWSIGWCHHDTPVEIVIVHSHLLSDSLTLPDGRIIHLVEEYGDAWQVFADAVDSIDAPIYAWTGFDASMMRSQASSHIITSLSPRMQDLHAIFKQTVVLPAKSNSLKIVAPFAGYDWVGHQDWFEAWQDYNRFLATHNPAHLTSACKYQANDVEAMVTVFDFLHELK